MGITEKQYEDIQNYLDGKMQPEEQEVFEYQLQTDPLLKEYLLFEDELRANLDYIKDNEAINHFSEQTRSASQFDDPDFILNLVEQTSQNKSTNTSLHVVDKEEQDAVSGINSHSFPFSRYVAAAACLIFLSTGVVWLVSHDSGPQPVVQTSTNKKIYIAVDKSNGHSTSIPSSNTSKSAEPLTAKVSPTTLFKKYYRIEKAPTNISEELADALNDYNAKDYIAIQQIDLENLPKSRGAESNHSHQNINELGHYFKGLSYMETDNHQEAITNLQWVVDSAISQQLKTKAQWYLALSYLKARNIGKAESLLMVVSQNADAAPVNKQAKELLAALK
jgi:hypothetical protein